MIDFFLAILLLLNGINSIANITDINGFQRLDVSDLDQIVGTLNVTKNVRVFPATVEIMPKLVDRLIDTPELSEFNTYFGLTFPKTALSFCCVQSLSVN